MKKLDIKLHMEELESDLIYQGRGGSGWSISKPLMEGFGQIQNDAGNCW